MDFEKITIQMTTLMKGNGKKTKNLEMELSFGRMEINMLEHLNMT